MAQLSVFEKLKHFSDKDLTCSIGKNNSIDFVFRHDSWKQFTPSEHIAVYIGNTGKLKFDDPEKKKGVIYKLKKSKVGTPSIAEHTRYMRINGQAHPELLEAAKKMIGDYNIPKREDETAASLKLDPAMKYVTQRTAELIADHYPRSVTVEEVREAMNQPTLLANADGDRDNFRADAITFLEMAQSPEERVEIWKTLASIYGKREVYEDKPGKWNV